MIRILLLTAARREKVLKMKWADLKGDIWVIDTQAGEKGNAGSLKLPPTAVAIIEAQPRIGPYVFTAERAGGPLNAIARYKERLDKASGVSGWVVHDLRRSARSLMARAGIRPDIAERVLGHAVGGIEGVYNRYQHDQEKANALLILSNLISAIVNPGGADNVVQMISRSA